MREITFYSSFCGHPFAALGFNVLCQYLTAEIVVIVTIAEQKFVLRVHVVLFIGKDVPLKLLCGTLVWFFHLVSDIAGSSGTAGKSGRTGLPGPILSLAKELSVLPVFRGNIGSFPQVG